MDDEARMEAAYQEAVKKDPILRRLGEVRRLAYRSDDDDAVRAIDTAVLIRKGTMATAHMARRRKGEFAE